MIDPEDIKARHRIEDLLTKRGVMLRNATAGFTCKCPIHQEQSGSSFSINARKQLWFCHGKCGSGGDIFTLIQHLDGAVVEPGRAIFLGRHLEEGLGLRVHPRPGQLLPAGGGRLRLPTAMSAIGCTKGRQGGSKE
jgi:hypothetical protein